MSKTLNTRIQHKADTSTNWSKATSFIPLRGELIIYTDLNKIKIGDGATNVNLLPFQSDLYVQDNEPALATTGTIWIDTSIAATVSTAEEVVI